MEGWPWRLDLILLAGRGEQPSWWIDKGKEMAGKRKEENESGSLPGNSGSPSNQLNGLETRRWVKFQAYSFWTLGCQQEGKILSYLLIPTMTGKKGLEG
ncbi:hypothetical protein SLEP1_g41203 [Rubroshorea leprosula]|uniref:Uncharacterized protein n=1 Tax=Rubroshorea leprosula TaxID=152421 RepID=A0AAV5L6B9_9ROSI|nr:hypothetical protein SLEP1_g41203 [Rubroshorea leprosula]